MGRGGVENKGNYAEWEEGVLRIWALTRAKRNGARFARDIGVGQASVSRFVSSEGKRMSPNLREAVLAYWRENGIDAVMAEAELVDGAAGGTADGTQEQTGNAATSFPIGKSGEGVVVDAHADADVDTRKDVGLHADADVRTGDDAQTDEDGGVEAGECAGSGGVVDAESVGEPLAAGESANEREEGDEHECEATGNTSLPPIGDVSDAADGDAAPAVRQRATDGAADASPDSTESGDTDGSVSAEIAETPQVNAGELNAVEMDTERAPRERVAPPQCAFDEDSVAEESVSNGVPPQGETETDSDAYYPIGTFDTAAVIRQVPVTERRPDEDVGQVSTDGADARDIAGDVADDGSIGVYTDGRVGGSDDGDTEVSIPILDLLPQDVASAGRDAVRRGWRWLQDPPPEGMHGDALFYLHTKEEVAFADEGAMEVALAPDRHTFACGLTGAEMRFGVRVRRRMDRHAVAQHKDRTLLIGERLAAVIPEVPYEDEDWFFGSEGITKQDGTWLPSAAELVARRRRLTDMMRDFRLTRDIPESRPFLLRVKVELRRVEIALLGVDYEMTFGEQVSGQRTWAPSTRLGIETAWRLDEIGIATAVLKSWKARIMRWVAVCALLSVSPARGFVRGVARLVLKMHGLWDDIFDHPMRRAAKVARSGQVPSRFAALLYRMLRSIAGVSPLIGECRGARDWTPMSPPWSEAYQMKYRPQDYTADDVMYWLPSEFDEDYRPLPALRRGELAEERAHRIAKRIEKERKRLKRREQMRRLIRHLMRPFLKVCRLPVGLMLRSRTGIVRRLPRGVTLRLPSRRNDSDDNGMDSP